MAIQHEKGKTGACPRHIQFREKQVLEYWAAPDHHLHEAHPTPPPPPQGELSVGPVSQHLRKPVYRSENP